MNQIYLDYNSTTPVSNTVLERMLPYFTEKFGNASSHTHSQGWIARKAVETATSNITKHLGIDDSELVFTSGSTESINLAIKGVFEKYQQKGKHFITTQIEHKAVLDSFQAIEKKGAEVTYLRVNKEGQIDLSELEKNLRSDTVLVSIMLANNETGIINDIQRVAELVHRNNSIFMSDITQVVGKQMIDINGLGIDLAPISAHKFYGPKGIGALYVRRRGPRVSLEEQMSGGGHQRERRSGTLNVPGIIGLSEAFNYSKSYDISFIKEIRDCFENELKRSFDIQIVGESMDRLPNTSQVIFNGIKAEKLISKCPGLCLSSGSACTSANPEPSHVLLGMGYLKEEALGAIRFSFGKFNQLREVKKIIEQLKTGIDQII